MQRLLTLLVAALATLPCAAEMARADLVSLSASVVKIEVLRAQGGYSLGSGVLVDVDKVATNCHVTHDAKEIHVVRGDSRWLVDAQSSDVNLDLCVLQVAGVRAETVELGRTADLKLGQSLTALGFTGGIGIQHSFGDVVALHSFGGSKVIQTTNWFSSGASGGGLFDDDRHLVGILTFRLRGGATHYFAAPADWLRPLIDDASRYRRILPLGDDIPFWQRPLVMQPNFLRAAVMERDRSWAELESLALDWSRADAGDPEPWYFKGIALTQLNQLGAARQALEQVVAIEPASSAAWFRLGLLYVRLGLPERAQAATQRLHELKPELALELAAAIEKI